MSLKSKIFAVFVFKLENFTPARIFLYGHRPWCLQQLSGMLLTAHWVERGAHTQKDRGSRLGKVQLLIL